MKGWNYIAAVPYSPAANAPRSDETGGERLHPIDASASMRVLGWRQTNSEPFTKTLIVESPLVRTR
jgi:hypothetical protein